MQKDTETSIIKWNAELSTIGYQPDTLSKLQTQRDTISMEIMLQTVRSGASEDKLDTILGELRAIRAKLDAKP